jgi:YD repeat-containing protein
VLKHPEFGQTFTRNDGWFDLVVNGGGHLTIAYTKPGSLKAQRQVNVPWQDFAVLPEVVLIQPDPQVTTIDLNAPVPMQVARGSVMTDEDGTRQATLFFPQGTQATMVLPNSSTQPLSTLNVRATEYTVGERGVEAMPAELPLTSAYTYAMEFTVEEAEAVGATHVRFDQPVFFYVENFLGFPVGSPVPVGSYERDRGEWVASQNGRIIKILSLTNGLAELDTNGDEITDSTGTLAALGITDAERQQLAALYTPGQSLWRVPIPHFTMPWDCNWPYGPPDDATGPDQPDPAQDIPIENSYEQSSSILECQNQVLGERLPMPGTPFTLNYRSNRVRGHRASYTLDISLSGTSVPASLLSIRLEILVAGQSHSFRFPDEPNQRFTFAWDGNDAYGRPWQGAAQVTVRIGYVYPFVYLQPSDFERVFALFCSVPTPTGASVCMSLRTNRGRSTFTVWQEWKGEMGGWDARAQGLGGWSLDVHHAYDPIARVLYQGDGGRRSAESINQVIRTVAGSAGGGGFLGDGGLATKAQLNFPNGVALAPDGSIYIADTINNRIRRVDPNGVITTAAGGGTGGDGDPATQANLFQPLGIVVAPDGSFYFSEPAQHRIRRVGPDGIITTVAGTGVQGFNGDGGLATQAQLNGPSGIDLGSEGSLYIADSGNHRIRRVGPDGIITTVAGNGTLSFSGDDGPATAAGVRAPDDVAVGSDGSFYIAVGFQSRVRRVGPDGIITTVAGTGVEGFSGDGGLAIDAQLGFPRALAMAPDGNLYIGDDGFNNQRIRLVSPNGIIITVAGTGTEGFSGDNGPPTRASLNFRQGLTVGPDSTLYIADRGNHRIRVVGALLPGFSAADIALPSEDGQELYQFDATGRHLRTLDTLMGALLYAFIYDSAGLLGQVEDDDGNITTIERKTGGDPSALIASGGQRTEWSTDPAGYLTSLTNPAAEVIQLTYSSDGLLATLRNPRGFLAQFSYDDQGRVVLDEDAAGGSQTLKRLEIDEDTFEVTRTTALSRVTSYQVEQLSTGGQRRVNTFPDGTQSTALIQSNGVQTVDLPDGTQTTLTLSPDPRFGMQPPLASSLRVRTPAGLTAQVSLEALRWLIQMIC